MEAIALLSTAFDGLLCLALLWLGWRTLACADLFRAIVLFIAFGLLMALAWVRLEAPDVALAEAAIGAGLTGALLLAAWAKLRAGAASEQHQVPRQPQAPGFPRWLTAAAVVLMALGIGYGVTSLAPVAAGLSAETRANLAASGVSHPVTAVLLNFRGYDTLLETVVLLLALLAVWSLGAAAPGGATQPGPVLNVLARLLMPVLILVAAYLLWVGAHAPGGAFQAGSVLGAAGVLLLLSGWRLRRRLTHLPLRVALVAGPAAFLVVALLALLAGRHLLEFPPAQAGSLILFLEAAATLSIGLTLAALFLGTRPGSQDQP